jgi:glyoxylase-like metal-dependent hydrolase (beta-lactamase superfamily II)
MSRFLPLAAGLLLALAALPVAAQQDFDDVEIKVHSVADGVHMLTGQGGNIGVSSGPDGVLLIDDQFAPLTEKIQAAVATFSDGPVRFVLNTHWHGDHTGGNENLGEAGAVIIAHDNVRARMSVEQFMKAFDRKVPASPPAALPVVTFSTDATLHLNGQDIHIFHVEPAHTDGDSIVHFRTANVLHMGDTFFAGRYPFIDLGSGGSIDGVIAAVDRGLALSNAETRIIPGHGPLSNREGLESYRNVLATVRERVAKSVAAGQSADEAVATGPSGEFDAAWGGGFVKPEAFVRTVYASLKAK